MAVRRGFVSPPGHHTPSTLNFGMNRVSALARAVSGEEICPQCHWRKGLSPGFNLVFELFCYEKEENEVSVSLRGNW